MGARPWWSEGASNTLKLVLVLAALALLAWEGWRRRHGRPLGRAAVDRALAALGVAALGAYVNLGQFHIGMGFVHAWDHFHHYVGAKYFDELGYDGLYQCKVVADLQEPGADTAALAARPMTDLRTNQVVPARDVVEHPETCLRRFSPQRWQAFRADVAVFRAMQPAKMWADLQLDHGFNASPAWMLAARPFLSSATVTPARVRVLAAIDLALVAAALGAVAWAFGLRGFGVAALVLGCYFPSRWWWTGGSFLRWDWLAALLGGLSLARRGRHGWAGVLLGYAALSRMFPALALAGVALGALANLARRRPPSAGSLRLLAGAALAIVLVAPLAAVTHPGPTWPAFARNLTKHTSVPSSNRMGVPTLLSVDFSAPRTMSRAAWEQQHATTLAARRTAWAALALAAAVIVALAARDQPPFASAALGLLLAPFGLALASYYYAFVAAVSLLAARNEQVATMLLALVAAAALVAGLERYATDAQYAAQALVAVVGLAFVLSLFVGPRREAADAALTDSKRP